MSFTTTLSVAGMTCSACVNSVTAVLKEEPGVVSAEVSLMTERAFVKHDSSVSPERLREAIEDCGFDSAVLSSENAETPQDDNTSVSLRIYGMTCSSCSNSIESVVSELDGVASCNVSLTTEEARVVFDTNKVGIRTIIETIEDCGFDAIVNNALDLTSQLELLSKIKEIQYWRDNLLQCITVGVPVFFLGHILPMIRKQVFHVSPQGLRIGHGVYLEEVIQIVLTTYIQMRVGKRYYISAFSALKHGSGTMDLLICISTTIAYTYSVISMLLAFLTNSQQEPTVLFDTSAMLFIFVSLGKWVENRAKGQTSTALSKLLSLTPSTCTIIENWESVFSEDGELNVVDMTTRNIGVDLLEKNDIALILPGAKVPTDGVCIYGTSEVDESLLTGESLPVVKGKGSRLIGGSVNQANALYMRVLRVGENTELQQIVKLVHNAQIAKAPIQRYADKIASKFVPTILVLSLLTLISWMGILGCITSKGNGSTASVPKYFLDSDGEVLFSKILLLAVSVVVVACPCALGLAAPTAIMVGTGAGAKFGVLLKGGDVLEAANGIDCVLFDKTGTITAGFMKLSNYDFKRGLLQENLKLGESDVWAFLGMIESSSEHPIGKAITEVAKSKVGDPIEVSLVESQVQIGSGISAVVRFNYQTYVLKVGNYKMMLESHISNISDFQDVVSEVESKESSELFSHCSTLSHVLINDYYVGYMEMEDVLKTDAQSTIAELMTSGYSVGLVTGDNQRVASFIARSVGIPQENCFANCRPDEKLALVNNLQTELGLKVAFVGDGINDAPALVKADLGIAIASGTDIAIDSADVVLLSNDTEADTSKGLWSVVSTFSLSRKTFNRIRLNFLWAMIYNLVMLPVAMGFLIPIGITMHPMLASLSMAFSSVSVVLSSLLLKTWKPPKATVQVSDSTSAAVQDTEADVGSLSRFKVNRRKAGFMSRLGMPFSYWGTRQQNSGDYELLQQ
ncbi:unnamed protein product [Kuraishia capsulata CBS 1993]|uniref:P-type Cu(+) transporter n=1 Tax=Kuraishia capsulata CBS 1993 TaxID=1382522 RepID=W6MQZ9_9ASCO|nr:uncharacterized protein KUCA_T00003656001 [Kuraishia capsulata CBS 1993]CDK27677.1 unnamed protein product [Kuraishia capsulata CBS 1993]